MEPHHYTFLSLPCKLFDYYINILHYHLIFKDQRRFWISLCLLLLIFLVLIEFKVNTTFFLKLDYIQLIQVTGMFSDCYFYL